MIIKRSILPIFLLVQACTHLFAAADSFQIPNKLADPSALRVSSYNIRREGDEKGVSEREWNSRAHRVSALLAAINADIFGLQEPTLGQINDIKAYFTKNRMPVDFFGTGRGASWFGMGQDEYNPIFFNPTKVTLIEQSTFKINEIERFLGIWIPWLDGLLPRICTWGKFRINATGQEFYFYNTHFDHKFDGARRLCATNVAKHIAETNKNHLPVILVGDFNTDFVGSVKEALAGFKNTKDLAEHTFGPNETSTGWDNEKLKLIDHILKTGNISTTHHMVIPHEGDVYPSDHRPVAADIIVKQG